MDIILLLVGLVAGGSLMYIIKPNRPKQLITKEANLMLERIREVSKLVTIEGSYSEVIHYKEEKSKWLNLIPNHKKAVIIVKAKAMVGFDLKKAQIEIDEPNRSINVIKLPEAEVLSIEPEIEYYDLKDSALNRFKPEDYSKIQKEAVDLIWQKVMEGDLPEKAIDRGKEYLKLLSDFAAWNGWKMNSSYRIEE